MSKPLYKTFVIVSATLLGGIMLGACTPNNASTHTPKDTLTVYAAASLSDVMNELNAQYTKTHDVHINTSYASSGTLAKQIESGADADIFISADMQWAKHLAEAGVANADKQSPLLTNRLALIAPSTAHAPQSNTAQATTQINFEPSFDIRALLDGMGENAKLCTGNVESVPAGRYARQALTALGWYKTLAPRLVETQDVRSALSFVNRGECALGIVYETDVKVADGVRLLGIFPKDTHEAITYPAVQLSDSDTAKQYYDYLHSKDAYAIYQKYGFGVLAHNSPHNNK